MPLFGSDFLHANLLKQFVKIFLIDELCPFCHHTGSPRGNAIAESFAHIMFLLIPKQHTTDHGITRTDRGLCFDSQRRSEQRFFLTHVHGSHGTH